MLRFINVKTTRRIELVNISQQIEKEMRDAGFKNGVCYVFVPHTTAGVTINEGADPTVQSDMLFVLSKLVPQDPHYRHAEGNSDAHVKSSLLGTSLNIPVDEGKLMLGTWQAVFFAEFDGPRHRRVTLKFISE